MSKITHIKTEDTQLEPKKNKSKKKIKVHFFLCYFSKIIKEISPENSITSASKKMLNEIIIKIAKKISTCSYRLAMLANKKTITLNEIKGSIIIYLTGELRKKALALTKNEFGESHIPSYLAEKFLRKKGEKIRVSLNAPKFLASVLDYIAAEIIDIATIQSTKKRITVDNIRKAIIDDNEMFYFLNAICPDIIMIPRNIISRNAIRKIIRRLLKEQHISKNISPEFITKSKILLETYLIYLFKLSKRLANYTNRSRIMLKDIYLATSLLDDILNNNIMYPQRSNNHSSNKFNQNIPILK